MKYAAVPTVYHGVQMRSRLEARWAAFFDLCDVKWDYEPFDLPGWFPDFKVHNICLSSYFSAEEQRENHLGESSTGARPTTALIEVKPIHAFGDAVLDSERHGGDLEVLGEAARKINKANPEGVVLILGAEPFRVTGSVYEYHVEQTALEGSENMWYCHGFAPSRVPGLPEQRRWRARFVRVGLTPAGEYDDQIDIEAAWKQAGNMVQYRSPGRR